MLKRTGYLVKSLVLSIMIVSCAQPTPETSEASEAPKSSVQKSVRSQETLTKFKVSHVNAQQAYDLLQENKNIQVLDIRTAIEISKGHITGAVFADFYRADFEHQLSLLDRQTPYVVHCRSGGRSTKALATLKKLGFTNITHMDGGMNAWKKAKLPLVLP